MITGQDILNITEPFDPDALVFLNLQMLSDGSEDTEGEQRSYSLTLPAVKWAERRSSVSRERTLESWSLILLSSTATTHARIVRDVAQCLSIAGLRDYVINMLADEGEDYNVRAKPKFASGQALELDIHLDGDLVSFNGMSLAPYLRTNCEDLPDTALCLGVRIILGEHTKAITSALETVRNNESRAEFTSRKAAPAITRLLR